MPLFEENTGYLGLGKTLFNSSACFLRPDPMFIELALTERLTRKKASGAWPEMPLRNLSRRFDLSRVVLAENRDVMTPAHHEDALNHAFPFFEYLQSSGLDRFSQHFNPDVRFLSHHLCHASAALLMSPFERSIMIVMDGAGSLAGDFLPESELPQFAPTTTEGGDRCREECTVYLQDRGNLRCVEKHWQLFQKSARHPGHSFSDGLGTLYEKAAEFIFADKRAAGKVMGLAPFGKPSHLASGREYLEALDWTKAFSGRGKRDWENSGDFQTHADLAATVQQHYEERLTKLVQGLRRKYPEYENLILTGGCALNCTNNMKLVQSGLFREVYIPPFPGDESIGLGAAAWSYYQNNRNSWHPWPHDQQHGYFGPEISAPVEEGVSDIFDRDEFEVIRPGSITAHATTILEQGHVIGWFQGRSESGPRALGNRSILARPDRKGLKDELNSRIKFRESFRPYGASVPHEKAAEYFEIPPGFNNPYMSFAVRTRAQFREALAEVTHIDGTSRIQTVRPAQNGRFHELLMNFGRQTGLFCLLNTSLNVMGEPIVESLQDARHFLRQTPVHGMAVGDFYVRKRGRS